MNKMGLFGNKQQTGEIPSYETSYMGFWIKIYSSRVEFRSGATIQSIALNQIASVEQGSFGFSKITLETTGGKRYSIPTSKKKEIRQAILDAQSKHTSNGQARNSDADELEKLNNLKEKGVITEEEFKAKKRQLLGI